MPPMTAKPRNFSHADLLRLWSVRATLARDLGVTYPRLQSWELRDSIPRDWWPALVDRARRDGKQQVTMDMLESAATARAKGQPARRNASKNPRKTIPATT